MIGHKTTNYSIIMWEELKRTFDHGEIPSVIHGSPTDFFGTRFLRLK